MLKALADFRRNVSQDEPATCSRWVRTASFLSGCRPAVSEPFPSPQDTRGSGGGKPSLYLQEPAGK